jgi:hypothetical protein
MAVKKNIAQIKGSLLAGSGASYDELFQLQDALESGDTGKFAGKTGTWQQGSASGSTYDNFDAGNLGSILQGGTEAIGAYKKRKQEQKQTSEMGFGRSQSILGGTVI